MADKKSFILYHSYNDFFSQLSDEEAGQLIKMIFAHETDDEYASPNRVVQMLFVQIKSTLERDRTEYEKTCNQRKKIGKLGGRPKKQECAEDDEETKRFSEDDEKTKRFSEDTEKTKRFFEKPKKPDNDNVNVNENVNENENDIVNVNVNVNENVHSGAQADNNNNDNNKQYGRFVRLTEQQYSQLVSQYGEINVSEYIGRVDRYIEQSGSKPYDNHFSTLRSWLEKDGAKKPAEDEHSYNIDKIMEYAMNHTPSLKAH